jgi:hypothetical protein
VLKPKKGKTLLHQVHIAAINILTQILDSIDCWNLSKSSTDRGSIFSSIQRLTDSAACFANAARKRIAMFSVIVCQLNKPNRWKSSQANHFSDDGALDAATD